MLNATKIKKDFPIFQKNPNLVYLDSTATSLKPQVVIDKLVEYYSEYSANIFRGLYPFSQKATAEHEETRKIVAKFIGAKHVEEIIFTKNASKNIKKLSDLTWREHLVAGLLQGFTIIPGISRSGSVYAAGATEGLLESEQSMASISAPLIVLK